MQSFKIIPTLGRKVDVLPDDVGLFNYLGEGIAQTYDVGGQNFDLQRRRNAASRSYGYQEWSNTVNATATNCLGLFELYDGTNRDHLIFDGGKVYTYDSSNDPVDRSGAVTFATDNKDIYSIVRVGSYAVWADRGETTPYIWKNGDASASKLLTSGTEFKFRYLAYFMNRVVGLYSDQTNGDIDIRWTAALPSLGTSMAAANQLFVPNDDPIMGGKTMGQDRFFIYSEDSIHQLVYYPDYLAPFRAYTVVPDQGCAAPHSIVTLGNRHFFFNKNYGFCEYRGDNQVIPIADDIETDMRDLNSNYYELMVGTFVPLTREICWTVCKSGAITPTHLFFYDIETKHWRIEDKAMRYVDHWTAYPSYTWNDLIATLGTSATATWNDASSNTWAFYVSEKPTLVYSNTNGHTYTHTSNALVTAAIDGHRIEPVMDFGNKNRRDKLLEIWLDVGFSGNFSVDISHRSGSTTGEVIAASWTSLGSISQNSIEHPVLRVDQPDKLHQIKWGTDGADEPFEVNGITFKYEPMGAF